MATVLRTSGFRDADAWATKADLTYALAAARVPKEVHLDWGLRSLQSVLRQAALARASQCRKQKYTTDQEINAMERRVVMKALSDATFSRVQGRSAEIFSEILRDVFGTEEDNKAQANQGAKFGATGEVEANLVNCLNV